MRNFRYILLFLLLSHGPAVFASGGDLSNLMLINFDKIYSAGMEVCAVRDPADAQAIKKGWNDWTSANANKLDELHRSRDKFSAWMKAQALDPKSTMNMAQRAIYFNGLDMYYAMASVENYRKLALQSDAATIEQCGQIVRMFKDMPPDSMLDDALKELRKLLADAENHR